MPRPKTIKPDNPAPFHKMLVPIARMFEHRETVAGLLGKDYEGTMAPIRQAMVACAAEEHEGKLLSAFLQMAQEELAQGGEIRVPYLCAAFVDQMGEQAVRDLEEDVLGFGGRNEASNESTNFLGVGRRAAWLGPRTAIVAHLGERWPQVSRGLRAELRTTMAELMCSVDDAVEEGCARKSEEMETCPAAWMGAGLELLAEDAERAKGPVRPKSAPGKLAPLATWLRFRIDGEVPDGFLDLWMQGLQDNAFREPLSRGEIGQRQGWAVCDEWLNCSFEDVSRWSFNHYVVLTLRVERKILDAKRVKALVAGRAAEWCREHGRERCPTAVRSEIKEQVEAELAPVTQPRVLLVPVVANVADGWVVLGSHNEKARAIFRQLWHRTTGLKVIEHDPLDGVSGEIRQALAGHDDEMATLDGATASEFLAWAWHREQVGRAKLEDDTGALTWWVDDAVKLGRDGKATVSLKADGTAAGGEMRAALAAGQAPLSMRIVIRRSDREYPVTLSGADLRIASAKLPLLVRGGDTDEAIYERGWCVEELHWCLARMFGQFAELRANPGRWSQHESSFRIYLGQEVRQFYFDEGGQGHLWLQGGARG